MAVRTSTARRRSYRQQERLGSRIASACRRFGRIAAVRQIFPSAETSAPVAPSHSTNSLRIQASYKTRQIQLTRRERDDDRATLAFTALLDFAVNPTEVPEGY